MIKKLLGNWLPVAAWCSLIFVLSNTPNLKTEFGGFDLVLRKFAHITEYCVLFLLARRAVSGSFKNISAGRASLLAAVFSVLYAVSDEIHQSFVPTRGPSALDTVIDTAGVAAGYVIYGFLKKTVKREHAI